MLILKLAKNTTLADCIDPQEAEVLGQAIELLVEVMQGPLAMPEPAKMRYST